MKTNKICPTNWNDNDGKWNIILWSSWSVYNRPPIGKEKNNGNSSNSGDWNPQNSKFRFYSTKPPSSLLICQKTFYLSAFTLPKTQPLLNTSIKLQPLSFPQQPVFFSLNKCVTRYRNNQAQISIFIYFLPYFLIMCYEYLFNKRHSRESPDYLLKL